MARERLYLFEYDVEDDILHNNTVLESDPLLLLHQPDTNGYRPVCWLDKEAAYDNSFIEFLALLRQERPSFDFFKLSVVTWLKDHHPGDDEFWKIDEEELHNCKFQLRSNG